MTYSRLLRESRISIMLHTTNGAVLTGYKREISFRVLSRLAYRTQAYVYEKARNLDFSVSSVSSV